jgi:hypothetical protein
MSPAVKYTLGRIGLFVVAVAALWPLPIDTFLKLAAALLISAVLSWFLLRGWRDEMAVSVAGAVERRREERAKLRAALAGEDEPESDSERR